MMNWAGTWGMMGWFGGLCMLLSVAAVVGVAFLVGRALQSPGQRPPMDTPEDVLRRRYAAGELSRAEYEQARRALGLTEPSVPQAI